MGYTQDRKSNAVRKRIDPLVLSKMLVLQQLFNLSDEEPEFQVSDRRSFEEFVGLGVMNNIPDATTGQIINATLVPVPKQRKSRQENKEIKARRLPDGWNENPHRLQ
jgi:transposase, IS5 family